MITILIIKLLKDEFSIGLAIDLRNNLESPLLDHPALIGIVILMNAFPDVGIVAIFA